MKKETAPPNSKDHASSKVLKANEKLICVNVLRVLVKFGLIREIDQLSIEHSEQRVSDLLKDEQSR
jgi:hypothetical protein